MKTNKILFTLALSLFLVMLVSSTVSAAVSVSQSYKQDFVNVREKWIYREDVTGGHRGFTLTHKFFMPREEVQINVKDNSGSSTTSASATNLVVGRNFASTYSGVGFGSGVVGSRAVTTGGFGGFGSSYSINNAFSTFRESGRYQEIRDYNNNYYGYSRGYVRLGY